jgi:hypothetical protein
MDDLTSPFTHPSPPRWTPEDDAALADMCLGVLLALDGTLQRLMAGSSHLGAGAVLGRRDLARVRQAIEVLELRSEYSARPTVSGEPGSIGRAARWLLEGVSGRRVPGALR